MSTRDQPGGPRPTSRPDGTRPSVRELLARLADDLRDLPGGTESVPADPLGWDGYLEQRRSAQELSGSDESVLCVEGTVGGHRTVLVAFDFRYLGGSISGRAGERVVRAFEHARQARLPVVSLVASGGSRMQEGMVALRQMQRIAAACQHNREAGVPHVCVARHPTTGGAWASLAAGADVVLALAGATVCFAGHRVRAAMGGPATDTVVFTGEGKLAHGQVDQVVTERELAPTLTRLLSLLAPAAAAAPTARVVPPAPVPRALGRLDLPEDGWSAVCRARDPRRPRAEAYLEDYFEQRFPLSGDRVGGTDPGMCCGLGRRAGRTIAYAAQTGVATRPAGYRAAARLVRLADRLGLPVLTLVDTPGAAHDEAAERAGLGAAISELFAAVAAARVPVTTLVIGEGGSGGALALASPDRTWITPDAYFSVIAPEAGAAILKRGPDQVVDTAEQLRLRPQDLVELGVVQGIAGAEPVE